MKTVRFLLAVAVACTAFGADEESRTDLVFTAFSKPGAPGCAAGVVREGKVLYAKGHGLANLEHSIALTPKSTFYLASVSKQFMAFAVLLAEQQGKLSIDDPVGKYVEGLPAHTAAVTLRQLLHHTGGVRDYLMLSSLAGFSTDHVWTERAALRAIARQKALNFAPGSEHLYSNSGYVLLSLAVQNAIGGKLDGWMRENVWTPLGMTVSRWQHDHSDPVPGRASGYLASLGSAGWKTGNSMLDTIGDGGMYASLEDLLKWAANFDDGKLGAALLERMSQPVANGYGMGLARSKYRGLETVAHGGALAGYRTMVFRVPSRKFTVVCLCNNGSANPTALSQRVADIWLEGAFEGAPAAPAVQEAPNPAKLSPPTAEQRASIAGEWFSSELEATYRIRDLDGKIFLEAGDSPPVELQVTEENKFRPARIPFTLERRKDALVLDAGRVRGIEFKAAAASGR